MRNRTVIWALGTEFKGIFIMLYFLCCESCETDSVLAFYKASIPTYGWEMAFLGLPSGFSGLGFLLLALRWRFCELDTLMLYL